MRGSANGEPPAAPAAVAGAAATAGLLLLSACGTGPGAPDGWRRLDTGQVSVSYPKGKGWAPVASPGRDTKAVVLKRRGKVVAKIAVRLRFMTGGDAGVAAAGAMAALQPGAKIKKNSQLRIDGRKAEKVEYTYRAASASAASAGPGLRRGTLVKGVDIVTLDAAGRPLLVRINAADGAVSPTQFRQIVNSVSLPFA